MLYEVITDDRRKDRNVLLFRKQVDQPLKCVDQRRRHLVITSYSIHYTKLYDLGSHPDRSRREVVTSQDLKYFRGIPPFLEVAVRVDPSGPLRALFLRVPGLFAFPADFQEVDPGTGRKVQCPEPSDDPFPISRAIQDQQETPVPLRRRITSYNVCYTKLLRSMNHLIVARDVATPNVERVFWNDTLQQALDKMALLNVDELPVVFEDARDEIVTMITKRRNNFV